MQEIKVLQLKNLSEFIFVLSIVTTPHAECGLLLHRILHYWWSETPAIPQQEYTEHRLSGNWYVHMCCQCSRYVRVYNSTHHIPAQY